MSKHHTLPPIIYTPPPKPKKIEKKRRVGIGRVGGRHRLHDDRMIAADADRFRVVLPGFILEKHRFATPTEPKHV